MKLQKLLSYTRKAIEEYEMIKEGDRIAIGISGGKDSLTLLYALHGLRQFYPHHFDIHAFSVDLGFQNVDWGSMVSICKDLDIPYDIIKTDIADVVFDERKETNPCSLCAKMRKGALNEAVKRAGFNKIAYGHHRNDAVETMLLSLLYEGRIHTFSPVTFLDRTDITVIRPLIYVEESDVIGFVKKHEIPVMKSPCPVDGHTKREYVKELLRDLSGKHTGLYKKMFTAIKRSRIEGWSI